VEGNSRDCVEDRTSYSIIYMEEQGKTAEITFITIAGPIYEAEMPKPASISLQYDH
jgi:hypothetical protein